MNISQSVIPALKLVGQLFGIHAHQAKDRSVAKEKLKKVLIVLGILISRIYRSL